MGGGSSSASTPEDEDDGDDEDGLTESDYERIEAFAQKDPGDRDPADLVPDVDPRTNGGVPQDDERRDEGAVAGGEVTPDLSPSDDDGDDRDASRTRDEDSRRALRNESKREDCREIRERMGEARTAREVVEEFPDKHVSEVMRHAYGNCNCEVEVAPSASPQIGPRECREFRDYYKDGYSVSEISGKFARSDNSVTRHIFGRCSHSDTPRDLSPSDVPEQDCRRLRATYNRNEKVDAYAVATALRLRREVANYHLFGLCECEHDEPAAEENRPLDPRRFRPPDGSENPDP